MNENTREAFTIWWKSEIKELPDGGIRSPSLREAFEAGASWKAENQKAQAAAACNYPDFRPQLSALFQAVEAYEKASKTGYSDAEWEEVLEANHAACIALHMDAHDAAVRAAVLAMAARIEELERESARHREVASDLATILHNLNVSMQSAWIEWQHGDGAESAMLWVNNTLFGPGLIPDEDDPHGTDAQAWFEANACPIGQRVETQQRVEHVPAKQPWPHPDGFAGGLTEKQP